MLDSPQLAPRSRLGESGEPVLSTARFDEDRWLFLPGVNLGWAL